MEKKTKIFPSGKVVEYKMTKEKGFFTSHAWVYRDGKPWLHFMPSKNAGFSQCFKNCGNSYMSMGEVNCPFEELSLNRIYLG